MAAKLQPTFFSSLLRRHTASFVSRAAPVQISQTLRLSTPTFRASQPHLAIRRYAHTIPQPPARTSKDTTPESSAEQSEAEGSDSSGAARVKLQPHYNLTFTCSPCDTKSNHVISKQGYHHGSVLVTCPGCRNRHIISDHLGIFGDRKITIEDLMREKGQLVKKGTLGEDGDIEFWEDDAPAQQGDFKMAGSTKS